jgi:hypothetical protein
MDVQKLWELEKSFWLGGPDFYETSMARDAHMIFPAPVGILSGEDIMDGLRQGPRWKSVDFDGQTSIQVGEVVVLAYKATGERDGDDSYVAFCGSTYVRQADEWRLLSHQQTPET